MQGVHAAADLKDQEENPYKAASSGIFINKNNQHELHCEWFSGWHGANQAFAQRYIKEIVDG